MIKVKLVESVKVQNRWDAISKSAGLQLTGYVLPPGNEIPTFRETR
jgi:hypothetical protein